ncbi:MAG: response regulator [Fimbriimonadaceae bacterium]|nr:response regulator [Chitinophagales bacterium]
MDERLQTKILLVEDNPADARLVEIYLNESTMMIPTVTKVQELRKGLLMMEEEDYDIVLLDLTLPDSSGFDTIKTMLDEFPEQSVIVMTGLEDETVALNSVKAGAQDFIVKGQFDSNLLSRTIAYAMERHQLQMKLENYAKAIKLNEQRLLEAQKMARIGNWELDIVTNQMYWSEEVFRILGRQQEFEPTLNDYLHNVDPAEVALVKEAINRSTEKGQPFSIEYKISLPDGNIKYVANQGLIQLSKKTGSLSLVGTIQDISNFTSRKDERANNIPKALSSLKNAAEKTTEENVKKLIQQAIEMMS